MYFEILKKNPFYRVYQEKREKPKINIFRKTYLFFFFFLGLKFKF